MTLVTCPTCKRSIEWSVDNKWRPFCCERCKLIDLGAWASEKHAIAGDNNINTEINPDMDTSSNS
ncbi:MAG TPA: DNA gyrase inhibitor YacG [Steroidobacteraceae bacterium]|nr:DNA gyrase inhibitor YacG [Steroidobacteraceae bacterium]